MADGFQFNVFGDDFDADLHRGTADVVDRRETGDQLTNVNGLLEQYVIYRKGDGIVAAVSHCAGVCDFIEKFK